MILCIGTTPAAQRVMMFRKLELDTVNRAVTTIDGVAGKSVNVAKVLRALGQPVVAAGFAGGDRGEEVLNTLRALGVELEFVVTRARTRQCITVIDQATGAITELVEESPSASAGEYARLKSALEHRISTAKAVVMSGTLAAGGPDDFYGQWTRRARELAILSVVDAQGQALFEALKERPGLVKPNRKELSATVGRELTTDTQLIQAIRELAERGAQRVVVTAGAQATLAFDGTKFWRVHNPVITLVNPIGSGDSVTAALVWRLLAGDDLGEACAWGAAAGAANAMTAMAGELHKDEVELLRKRVKVEPVG